MKTNCEKCGSSDAKHVYDDHEYCFSCSTRFKIGDNDDKLVTNNNTTSVGSESEPVGSRYDNYPSYPMDSRGISKQVVDHFGVKMSVDTEGKPRSHLYPYTNNGKTVGWKERVLPKEFYVHGSINTQTCLLYTSPSPRDRQKSRMPSSA